MATASQRKKWKTARAEMGGRGRAKILSDVSTADKFAGWQDSAVRCSGWAACVTLPLVPTTRYRSPMQSSAAVLSSPPIYRSPPLLTTTAPGGMVKLAPSNSTRPSKALETCSASTTTLPRRGPTGMVMESTCDVH